MPPVTTQVEKKIPAAACRFAADVNIGDNGAESKTAPVKITARTGDPVNHWWWGPFVHDLAGMKAKERCTIDYNHDPGEVLGYANQFDTATGNLVASGAIIPFKEKDRASEVLQLGKEGVPYEASILFDFDNLVLEECPAGMSTQANGKTFQGPITVARVWELRGIAICPYGYDANTSVQFSANPGQEITVKVTQLSAEEKPAEGDEPVEADPDKPAETPEVVDAGAVEGAEVPTDPMPVEPANALSQGARFLEAFGDQGGVWFAQGKSFEQAQSMFNKTLLDDNDKLRKENAALSAKLVARRGEKSPVSFQSGDPDPSGDADVADSKHAKSLPAGLAKFASGMKLPTQ